MGGAKTGGAYFVLGDARSDPRSMYGITPDELRERFRPEEVWKIAFVHESVFEWWHSHNRAYLAGVIKRE